MTKKTILVYYYADYIDSYLNLYTSVINLKLLDSSNLYSIIVYKSIKKIKDKSIIDKFDSHINVEGDSDLHGYYLAIKSIDLEKYDSYIFMNSSCIGPILPTYFNLDSWETIFTNKLKSYDLIAPIIEFPPIGDKYVSNLKLNFDLKNLTSLKNIPFAHSYFLALNRNAIFALLESNALPKSEVDKDKAVGIYERLITAVILNNGLKIFCLLRKYSSLDIEKKTISKIIEINDEDHTYDKNISDPEIPLFGYFGSDLSPYEVVFFKNIRMPHTHRNNSHSYISKTNNDFLNKIIGISKNKRLLKLNEDENLINKRNKTLEKKRGMVSFLHKIINFKNQK